MAPQFLHATLMITNLEQSQAFYGGVLGLELCCDRPLKFPGAWYQIGPIQLHLIVADQVICDQTQTQKWGRNRHIALGVEDLGPYHHRLQAAGIEIQRSGSGRAALFVHDPDGNIVELSEMAPSTVLAEAGGPHGNADA